MLAGILQDTRYAIRTLLRTPAFTVVALIAIALGVGANSAIFSVVSAVLIRPLPYPDSDRLVFVSERNLALGFPEFSFSPGNFLDYRTQNHSFTQISAMNFDSQNLSGMGDPERIPAVHVSEGFFDLLGVQPRIGRAFRSDEYQPEKDNSIVISEGLWRRRFGANAQILNTTVRLNDKPMTIVGVLPASFSFPEETQIWMPLSFTAKDANQRGGHYLGVIGRLKPGVSLEAANSDLAAVAKREQAQFPVDKNWDAFSKSLSEVIVGDVRPALITVMAAVIAVLLIACANLANLMLSRSTARQREIAIRTAIGASRLRIVQQLITESLLLAVSGGSFGVLLGYWCIRVLLKTDERLVPRAAEISFDWRVLLFTAGVALVSGILFGLAPAIQTALRSERAALIEGGRGSSIAFRRNRLRVGLVIGEVALSMVLLSAAGLLIRSFTRLQSVDPGYDPSNILTMRISPPDTRYPGEDKRAAFYASLVDKVVNLPGVVSAGLSSNFPLSGDSSFLAVSIPSHPPKPMGQNDSANFYTVSPGYLEAMHIPLKTGRYFNFHDNRSAQRVLIVSETFAKQNFPNEDPMGKAVWVGGGKDGSSVIVGIVGDVKTDQLSEVPRATMYSCALQVAWSPINVVIRTAGAPTSLLGPVKATVSSLDPDLPVDGVTTGDGVLMKSLLHRRVSTTLMFAFAAIALVLALVGIYGVMAYTVAQATQEIGIRVALGATARDVIRMVLRYGSLMAAGGLLIGVPAALGVTRLLKSQLYGTTPYDPLTIVTTAAILLVVAVVASVVPGLRALRVDPTVALRYE